MSWVAPCICDICRRMRGEANHWQLAMEQVGPSGARWLSFATWNDKAAHADDVKHLCSEECAHKMLARFLAPATPEPQLLECPCDICVSWRVKVGRHAVSIPDATGFAEDGGVE